MTTLSKIETQELAEHEFVIERGLATFVEVGTALLKIRDARLYRSAHETFEEYCRERWGMSKSHANRMIDAACVAENLGPIGPNAENMTPIGVIPTSESQARPLASLPPAQQREAWSEAAKNAPNGQPTAAQVKAVVDEMFPRRDPLPNQATFFEKPEPVWEKSEKQRRTAVEAGRSVVANMKGDLRLIGWAQENGLFVRVDRTTDWGNPFILDEDGDRDAVLEAYGVYLGYKPSLQRRYDDLRGKVLGCWCYPEECHGNVLIREAYGETADNEAQRVGCHR